MLHWLWTCFRQPVEPRCNPRVPFVTSLYTGGSSTSPSHPPPFDARPSPNRRGRRKDGPLCHRASHRLLTADALATPRCTSTVLCGASPVPLAEFQGELASRWFRDGRSRCGCGCGCREHVDGTLTSLALVSSALWTGWRRSPPSSSSRPVLLTWWSTALVGHLKVSQAQ